MAAKRAGSDNGAVRARRGVSPAIATDPQVTVSPSSTSAPGSSDTVQAFALERYRFVLQQINSLNENVFRFLAIYQTLATALVSAGLALFVGYRSWGVSRRVASDGVIGLLLLTTFVAAFTAIFIAIGAVSWLDYRHEECDLTDIFVYSGFRERPKAGNLPRWYELYIILFIVLSTFALWLAALLLVLPAMK